jgi:hypothetical protein
LRFPHALSRQGRTLRFLNGFRWPGGGFGPAYGLPRQRRTGRFGGGFRSLWHSHAVSGIFTSFENHEPCRGKQNGNGNKKNGFHRLLKIGSRFCVKSKLAPGCDRRQSLIRPHRSRGAWFGFRVTG